jgi:uncharacterized membrane protein YgcG
MRVLFALLFVFVSAAAPAQEKTLHWEGLRVKATLDADGKLHVEELQQMVFSGEWNGGERRFDIRPGQEFSFEGMSRVDESGTLVPMEQGSLDDVHAWDRAGTNVIRWRSRATADPLFDATRLGYLLRFSFGNILRRDGDLYVLDHDFAFADRDGTIERFRLDLTLDPAWQADTAQRTWEAVNILPGRSFVLTMPLRYTGSGAPAANDGIGEKPRRMLLLLAGFPLLLLGSIFLREKLLGRLERVDPSQVSRGWLEQTLLREKPEVIGAMWDGDVGAAEVSATLARLVSEGRLRSNVKGDEMSLEIVTRKDLNEYEQALLDGLFFRGNTTSTSAIRKHYADSGFNPAEKMAEPLKRYVQERLPKGESSRAWGWFSSLFFFAMIGAFIYAVIQYRDFAGPAIFIAIGTMVAGAMAAIAPNYWRPRKALGLGSALLTMIPATILTAGIAYVVWRSAALGSPMLPFEMQAALTVAGLWIFTVSAMALRSTESREAIAFLKMLGTARNFFRNELTKERPALDDAWYPYVLAFGLDDEVQKWFRSFPGAGSRDDRFHSSSMSSSSSSSSSTSFSPSSWSGGGGAFGGAGASGMWALAASGMAAGVAAPSSSSSGGGSSSSSSGGSSGGGGGGGW